MSAFQLHIVRNVSSPDLNVFFILQALATKTVVMLTVLNAIIITLELIVTIVRSSYWVWSNPV